MSNPESEPSPVPEGGGSGAEALPPEEGESRGLLWALIAVFALISIGQLVWILRIVKERRAAPPVAGQPPGVGTPLGPAGAGPGPPGGAGPEQGMAGMPPVPLPNLAIGVARLKESDNPLTEEQKEKIGAVVEKLLENARQQMKYRQEIYQALTPEQQQLVSAAMSDSPPSPDEMPMPGPRGEDPFLILLGQAVGVVPDSAAGAWQGAPGGAPPPAEPPPSDSP